MKVKLNTIHSPCAHCYQHGIWYNENSSHCQSCEYYIAIAVLKSAIEEDEINWEKVCERLGVVDK